MMLNKIAVPEARFTPKSFRILDINDINQDLIIERHQSINDLKDFIRDHWEDEEYQLDARDEVLHQLDNDPTFSELNDLAIGIMHLFEEEIPCKN